MDKKVMVGVHPKQIISHEVGHAIGKTDTEVHSIKMDIFKRYGNNTGMSVASPYSMLSSDEMVAEAFVIFRDYGRISKQFGALSELDPVFRRVMTSGVKL